MMPRDDQGFTLVELLVALLIFAMIAAAGVGMIAFVSRGQAQAQARLDRVNALQRLAAILASDLAQAVPRPARDAEGRPHIAFEGGTGAADTMALLLVRGGWTSGDYVDRGTLQKVEYRRTGDAIERRTWQRVDDAGPGTAAVLLRGVRRLDVRYRSGGEWRDRWDPTRPVAIPQAVEVTIDLAGTGVVRQLFLSGAGR